MARRTQRVDVSKLRYRVIPDAEILEMKLGFIFIVCWRGFGRDRSRRVAGQRRRLAPLRSAPPVGLAP